MSKKRIVYLFGAGATQGCLSFVSNSVGLLMRDLNPKLLAELRSHIRDHFPKHEGIQSLVYDVLDGDTDYEHVLTFLEQSPSSAHRRLAADARAIFQRVLSEEIGRATAEHGGDVPNDLYRALLDLHDIAEFPEEIGGLITLNYDGFLERAISDVGRHGIDWCMALDTPDPPAGGRRIPLVKLHGSFEWSDCFPVRQRGVGDSDDPLWIPPGIRKEKSRYPFNTLWGRVRELLNCDTLRVVGWNLGPNDWDLISLLFSTRHGNDERPPYDVEVVGSPAAAERIKASFPYLGVKSLLETDRSGEALIGEYLSISPTPYAMLGPDQQERAVTAAGSGRNWFLEWLKRNIEWAYINLEIPDTYSGALRVLEDVA